KTGHKCSHGITTGSCCKNRSRPAHALQDRSGILGGSVDVDVGYQIFRKLLLLASPPDCHGTESHVPGKLNPKMAKATYALNGDQISTAQTSIAKSVVGRDARAEQRSGFCRCELI